VVLIDAENELQQMKDVSINHEPIELFKILKIEGLVSSGGMAKTVIADGQVLVNGIEETRKRKKIVAGDVVKFGDKEMRICLA
jgi:ribosome-associated protein